MKVNAQLGHYDLKVFIEDVVHICIDRSKFIGYQTYFETPTKCTIEFHLQGSIMKCEYDSVQKWKAVINAINKVL